MSNVVVFDRGAQTAMPKGSAGKSNTDGPDNGTAGAEVTVLFPRTKIGASAWAKAQKSAAEAGTDGQKQDESSDAGDGQNLFGSLVASVEQRLTQPEKPLTPDNDSNTAAATIQSSMRPTSQLIGRGKLADALQNFKEKPAAVDVKKGQFSALNVDQAPVPESSDLQVPDGTNLLTADAKPLKVTEANILPVPNEHVLRMSDRDNSKAAFSDKSANGNFQVPKSSVDKVASQSSTPATTGVWAPNSGQPEKVETQFAAVKPAIAEKKDSGLPKADLSEVSDPHVAPVSYPTSGEGKLLSPAAQIVENIRNAIPAAPVVTREVSTNPMPVKTLEVQLQPEGLGLVTVSLKSEQGKLKVEISAKLESTRHELERNAIELVSGLQRVDPTIKSADINFSNQNQDNAADNGGQASSNGSERRSTPENLSGFGSNGDRDANQPSANARHEGHQHHRHGHKRPAGELPSRLARADGIYL
jgi:flagellar hook-length control protein FliK